MARMMSGWLQTAVARTAWEIRCVGRRAAVRWGWPGLAAGVALVGLVASVGMCLSQHDRWLHVSRSVAAQTAMPLTTGPASTEPGARARLQAFYDQLSGHDEIPAVLQDLIALAEANGLVLKRGTYRPQPELQGGYLRYRMTLPVTGPAVAIQQFIKAALKAQRSLSLESVQFKRERGESSVVEAHIQWSLLTRLPSVSGGNAR